jgi:serine/threonine protein kinase
MSSEAHETGVSHDTTSSLQQEQQRHEEGAESQWTGGDGGSVGGGGSVVSESTQTTQTRFSFYNAEDYVNKSPQKAAEHSSNNDNYVDTSDSYEMNSATQRFSFYTGDALTPVAGNGVNQALAAEPGPPSGSDTMETTTDILKSLEAHEQQRNEILQPQAATAVPSQPSDDNSPPSDSSNPYEDAIKDALELLRRHRTGLALNRATVDATEEGVVVVVPPADQNTNNVQEISFTQEDMDALSKSFQEVNVASEDLPAATPVAHTNTTAALGEAYQAEIEARRRQRQERMAKYANRLAELKQEVGTSAQASTTLNPDKQPLTPLVGGITTTIRADFDGGAGTPDATTQLATARSAPLATMNNWSADMASQGQGQRQHATNKASSSSGTANDDVQRGVEKVLLAILERANSRGRAPSHTVSVKEEQTGYSDVANGEEKEASVEKPLSSKDTTEEDLLVQAMSDLLGAASSSSIGSSSPNRDAIRQWVEAAQKEAAVAETAQSTGPTELVTTLDRPVAHLLASPDELDEMILRAGSKERSSVEEDSFDRKVRSILSQEKPSQSQESEERTDTSGTTEKEKMNDASLPVDESDEDAPQNTQEEDGTLPSGSFDDYGDDDGDETSTSGGEYHDDEYSDEDDEAFVDHISERRGELDGVLGPLSKKAGGTTGVVIETDTSEEEEVHVTSPTILESLSAAMSMVTGRDNHGTADKYAIEYGEEDSHFEEDSEEEWDHDENEEDESTELMRTLCAHLLPVGVSQSTNLLDNRPAWDESNPDEAGYRIIRLTLQQLSEVEDAFDRMVTGLRQNSERKLSMAGTDEAFERDLRTAEDLLDQSEKLFSKGTEVSQAVTTFPDEEPEPFEFAKECGEGESLQDFPGVKPTGRGEMGDLEYFHLPIIFKSHVTGFEPTKDISLEPGNIVAGQYLVEGELGSAAFSTAYRCVDLNSSDDPDEQDEVCLKVIKNTKDFFDQSLDEIKILELLRQTGMCHEKCIVEMRTFFYHREHLIIVTELLRQNLYEFGKFIVDNDEEPYFTITRLAYITRQVLIALEFVHRLGLVHSDVKPENILLGSYSRARVKLIDFGSSCYLTDRQSSYIQSRSYRAPEVVLGLPYDGRIDIWSLGCVVAEMFTGEVTFQNDSIVSMLSRIEAICGTFPRHMIAQGRQSGRFFAKSGLLFEKVSTRDKDDSERNGDESGDEEGSHSKGQYVDIFQPKTTTMSARLGFAADLLERHDSSTELSKEESKQALFVDFVRKLLTIDPDVRPTARQALQHPWMRFAETVTEEAIKYPSG